MLRIDQIFDEFKQFHDGLFQEITSLKQNKSELPQRFKNLAAELQTNKNQLQALIEQGQISSQLLASFDDGMDLLSKQSELSYKEHNVLISGKYTYYVIELTLSALKHMASIGNTYLENPDSSTTAIDKCKQISVQVDVYLNEITKEINEFVQSLKGESEQSQSVTKELVDDIAKNINDYRELANLLLARLNLAREQSIQLTYLRILLQSNQVTQADKDGSLRLAASRGGQAKLISLLIRFGANVAAQDDSSKKNPLHFVCQAGDLDGLSALIENQNETVMAKALQARDATNKSPRDYISELKDDVTKQQMITLISKYDIKHDQTASQLHKLRTQSDALRSPRADAAPAAPQHDTTRNNSASSGPR